MSWFALFVAGLLRIFCAELIVVAMAGLKVTGDID